MVKPKGKGQAKKAKSSDISDEIMKYQERIFEYVDQHNFHEEIVKMMSDCFKQSHPNPWLFFAERAAELGGVSWADFQSGGIIDELKRQIANHERLTEHLKKKFGHQVVLDYIAEVAQAQASESSSHTDEPAPKKQGEGSKYLAQEIAKADKVMKKDKASTSTAQLKDEDTHKVQSQQASKEDSDDSDDDPIEADSAVPSPPVQVKSSDKILTQDPKLATDPKVVIEKFELNTSMNESGYETPKTAKKSSQLDSSVKATKLLIKPFTPSTPSDKFADAKVVKDVQSSSSSSTSKLVFKLPSTPLTASKDASAEAQKVLPRASSNASTSNKEKFTIKPSKLTAVSASKNPFGRKTKESSQKDDNSKATPKEAEVAKAPQAQVKELPVAEVKQSPVGSEAADSSQEMVIDESVIEKLKKDENEGNKGSAVESDEMLSNIDSQMKNIHEGMEVDAVKSSEIPIAPLISIPSALPDSEELSAINFDSFFKSSEEPEKIEGTPMKKETRSSIPSSGGKNLAMMTHQVNEEVLKEDLEKAIKEAEVTKEVAMEVENTESGDIAEAVVKMEIEEKKEATPMKAQAYQVPSDDFEPDYEPDE